MKKLLGFLFVIVLYSNMQFDSVVEYLIFGLGKTEEQATHMYAEMLKDAWKEGIVYYDFRDQEIKQEDNNAPNTGN